MRFQKIFLAVLCMLVLMSCRKEEKSEKWAGEFLCHRIEQAEEHSITDPNYKRVYSQSDPIITVVLEGNELKILGFTFLITDVNQKEFFYQETGANGETITFALTYSDDYETLDVFYRSCMGSDCSSFITYEGKRTNESLLPVSGQVYTFEIIDRVTTFSQGQAVTTDTRSTKDIVVNYTSLPVNNRGIAGLQMELDGTQLEVTPFVSAYSKITALAGTSTKVYLYLEKDRFVIGEDKEVFSRSNGQRNLISRTSRTYSWRQ